MANLWISFRITFFLSPFLVKRPSSPVLLVQMGEGAMAPVLPSKWEGLWGFRGRASPPSLNFQADAPCYTASQMRRLVPDGSVPNSTHAEDISACTDMGYTNRNDMLPCVWGEGGTGYSVDSLSRSLSNSHLPGTYKDCQANRLSTGTGTQYNLRYVDISGGYFLGSGCSLQVGAAGQLGWEASLLRLLPGRAHNFVWAYGTAVPVRGFIQ